jgi:hypothetical protein
MGDPYYENRIADLESKYELLRWIAEGQVAKLQAERDMYKAALERIYDNCSDTDLIIDIVDAALDTTEEVE